MMVPECWAKWGVGDSPSCENGALMGGGFEWGCEG